MRGFVTTIKIGAFLLVIGVLAALVLFLPDYLEEFQEPTVLKKEDLEKLVEEGEDIGFEAGQYEFNQALELIALGEIDQARERLHLIENLYPESTHAKEARRILGEINLDEILSVENMDNKRIHRVSPGEGYLRIANDNQTTLDAIMFLNGLTDFKALHTGDELVVMPLDFKLVVDLSMKRVELYHRDQRKKEHIFARDYPILGINLDRMSQGVYHTTVSRKMGETADGSVPPSHRTYRHASKVLGIKAGRRTIQLCPITEQREDGGLKGVFLAASDMEELSMLIRIGNEVEFRIAG